MRRKFLIKLVRLKKTFIIVDRTVNRLWWIGIMLPKRWNKSTKGTRQISLNITEVGALLL